MRNYSRKTRENIAGYAMAMPYIIYFCVFVGFPVIFSFVLIFNKWDVLTPMRWAGLSNFERLFNDVQFYKAIRNTLVFLVIYIPLQMVVSLGLAVLLNCRIRAQGLFRVIYFMPVIVSGVVVTILWQQLYAFDTGVLNTMITSMGFKPVPWLSSANMAMPSIAIMAAWKGLGLYIIFFLIGLQAIPRQIYEAADIDGANSLQKFLFITLPSLRNVISLIIILSTIGGFSLFVEPFVMTGGGPMSSTLSVMLYIYNQAFIFGHMGYAAAMSFLFTLIILVIVLFQKKVLERSDMQ
jgi:multiple sugar transport system permease protein